MNRAVQHILILVLLFGLNACAAPDSEDASGDIAELDGTPAASAPGREEGPQPAGGDTVAVQEGEALSGRPSAPMRIEGACPFECCTYGDWTTTESTNVYRKAGDTTDVAFTLPAGTAVDAESGHVLVARIGSAVAYGENARLYRSNTDFRPVAAGDTVLTLDYVGEGNYHVWYDGGIYEAEVATPQLAQGDTLSRFVEVRKPVRWWWAQITAPDGRTGWLWMDRTAQMDGSDACSG